MVRRRTVTRADRPPSTPTPTTGTRTAATSARTRTRATVPPTRTTSATRTRATRAKPARAARAGRVARVTPSRATAAAGAGAATATPTTTTAFQGEPVEVEGLLDLRDEGYGFLRLNGYLPSQGRRLRLGQAGPPVRPAQGRPRQGREPPGRPATRRTRRCCASTRSTATTPDQARSAPAFEDLTPLFPDERLHARARRTTRAT